ncbi:MAG: DUF6036 family nucleotidyltransferase [Acidimicrobiales bacterium]
MSERPNSAAPSLTRAEILSALHELDAELGRRGTTGEIFVVGGAAVALAYDIRRTARDVDATFAPSAEIRLAARWVAEERGLDQGWLGDSVKAFMPGDDPNRIDVYAGDHLRVAAASPEYLLAMKLLASRVDRDRSDIRALYGLCGFTTAEDGIELVAATYPEASIAARTRFVLEEMYPSRQWSPDRNGPGAPDRAPRGRAGDLGRGRG